MSSGMQWSHIKDTDREEWTGVVNKKKVAYIYRLWRDNEHLWGEMFGDEYFGGTVNEIKGKMQFAFDDWASGVVL